jgi:hypothetical protein
MWAREAEKPGCIAAFVVVPAAAAAAAAVVMVKRVESVSMARFWKNCKRCRHWSAIGRKDRSLDYRRGGLASGEKKRKNGGEG